MIKHIRELAIGLFVGGVQNGQRKVAANCAAGKTSVNGLEHWVSNNKRGVIDMKSRNR